MKQLRLAAGFVILTASLWMVGVCVMDGDLYAATAASILSLAHVCGIYLMIKSGDHDI